MFDSNHWRKTLLGPLLAIVLAVIGAPLPANAGPAEDAQAVVRQTTDRVLERLRKDSDAIRQDSSRVYGVVNELVVPHLDRVVMARLALGKHWRTASKQQRDAFVDGFTELLVRTYGTALAQYRDQKVNFRTPRVKKTGKRVLVPTEVMPNTGPAIPIAYSMRIEQGDWKIYDVAIDGISLITSYRTEYNARVRKMGLNQLIADIGKRNQRTDK